MAGPDLRLGHDDPDRPPVLHHGDPVDPDVVMAEAGWRLLGHLDLGDQVAPGRLRTDELDTGRPADDTAPTICPDQVRRPPQVALRKVDVDAGVVLGEAGDLEPAVDRHPELLDPAAQDPLDVALRQRQRVRMTRGEAGDLERGAGEAQRLNGPSLDEEPVGDTALVEDLDRSRVKPSGTSANQVQSRTPLQHHDINPRQRQLARQHQTSRPAADNRHVVHVNPRSPRHDREVCGPTGALPQAPPPRLYLGSGKGKQNPCLCCPRPPAGRRRPAWRDGSRGRHAGFARRSLPAI